MNPYANSDYLVENSLRLLLDPAIVKKMPANSATVIGYESWKGYMLLPNGQVRGTAQPRIYRTNPNGDLTLFTGIAGAVHRKLTNSELSGEKIRLNYVPGDIAGAISRTLVPDVDAVVQMLPPLLGGQLVEWFNNKYYNEFLPQCEDAREALRSAQCVREELNQWRSSCGNPLLLRLFHNTTDLILEYKREWYPKAGLHAELDEFERLTVGASTQATSILPYVDWLWPDINGQYKPPITYWSCGRK